MVWCVIALEQVLVWDSFTLKHSQFQTLCLEKTHKMDTLRVNVRLERPRVAQCVSNELEKDIERNGRSNPRHDRVKMFHGNEENHDKLQTE
jgi:hypothetical protein